jgi:streptomycin 6-kinase
MAVGAGVWLDGLPNLIRDLERDWAITVGRPFDDATEAFVAEVVLDDGAPAVLKVLVPRDGRAALNEVTALRLVGGEGCPLMLRASLQRGAILLERLGRPLSELDVPVRERHAILVAAAERIWRPVSDGVLPSGAEKARSLGDFITRAWKELDRPCSERAVADALACAGRRAAAHDEERAVLVHGDVHQWNALEAGDGSFKLADPDGLVAEPEYDLGIIMREDPVELLRDGPEERARRLAALTGLDATAIWEWGVVERVSTGLLATKIGLQPVGREMLEAADRVAGRMV